MSNPVLELCDDILRNWAATMPMHIILIGAHGTGKTTLANAIGNELGIPVTESVARAVKKCFETIFIESPGAKELALQNTLCELSRWDFTRWKECINVMTRCPLDTLAYAKVNAMNSTNPAKEGFQSIYDHHLEKFKQDETSRQMLKQSVFLYLPIEFPLEQDGVRPMDVEYQKQVDEAMRQLIYELNITPIMVSGTVEERVRTFMDHFEKVFSGKNGKVFGGPEN